MSYKKKILSSMFHKPLKQPIKDSGPAEAVDFGYSEVMTDTQDNRYGTQFGKLLEKASQARHKKMQKRHHLHSL